MKLFDLFAEALAAHAKDFNDRIEKREADRERLARLERVCGNIVWQGQVSSSDWRELSMLGFKRVAMAVENKETDK